VIGGSSGSGAGLGPSDTSTHRITGIQPEVLNSGGCYGASFTDPGAIHSFDLPCTSNGYGGEPALAFDPLTAGHCHTDTGTRSVLTTTNLSNYSDVSSSYS